LELPCANRCRRRWLSTIPGCLSPEHDKKIIILYPTYNQNTLYPESPSPLKAVFVYPERLRSPHAWTLDTLFVEFINPNDNPQLKRIKNSNIISAGELRSYVMGALVGSCRVRWQGASLDWRKANRDYGL